MKLDQLIFTNVYCYRDKRIINFKDNNIINIVGPPGSGKSVIVDILNYAIYNNGYRTPISNIHCDESESEVSMSLIGDTDDGAIIEIPKLVYNTDIMRLVSDFMQVEYDSPQALGYIINLIHNANLMIKQCFFKLHDITYIDRKLQVKIKTVLLPLSSLSETEYIRYMYCIRHALWLITKGNKISLFVIENNLYDEEILFMLGYLGNTYSNILIIGNNTLPNIYKWYVS